MQYRFRNDEIQNKNSYFIQVLIEKVTGFSAILSIAIFQGCLMETILFLLGFSNLRKYTGGFHTKKFSGCFLETVSIYLVYVKLLYPYFFENRNLNRIVLIAAGIIILILGAVNHPNMDWDKREFLHQPKRPKKQTEME